MRIVRFATNGHEHLGNEHGDGRVTLLDGDLFGELIDTGEVVRVEKRLAPLEPRDILCIGLNYRRHAEEGKQAIPTHREVDYECELAVVIGKTCHNVKRENALEHVLGYTCANDVSARDWQRQGGGGQWCRGKTFATFCPLGPVLVTRDEIANPNALKIRTVLNGRVMQDWNTDDMIFDVPTVIEFLSASSVLRPGTVILTGTPHGVGFAHTPPVFLRAGDSVSIEIEGIGTLTNPVIEEQAERLSGV